MLREGDVEWQVYTVDGENEMESDWLSEIQRYHNSVDSQKRVLKEN